MAGLGQIKHTSVEQVRGQGYDIKGLVLTITGNIILSTKGVIQAQDYQSLVAWGGEIEAFDAFIYIYYQNDNDYKEKRDQYVKKIDVLFDSSRSSYLGRRKIFRLYVEWFGLICKKLARFKIFPPLPVSYAQGVGEVYEAEN